MRLLFFGTSEFAVPALEALAPRHEIAAVVTQPDRPAGRGHKLTATPVKRAAERLGLQVVAPERLRAFAADARGFNPDAFVVASYGRIVPQALLDVVPVAFNIHPSLLPLYRGATPLQSAIRDGRTETGVTIIAMDAGMDTGDVLLDETAAIGPEETYGELHDRLARRGAAMAADALQRYAEKTLSRTPQAEVARARGITDDEIARTLTRPLRKEDLAIDWSCGARGVVDQVRSLAPQPLARTDGAFGETVKVAAAHALSMDEFAERVGGNPISSNLRSLHAAAANGTFWLYAGLGDGVVVVDRVVAPNRGAMTGAAYAQSVVRKTESITGWTLS